MGGLKINTGGGGLVIGDGGVASGVGGNITFQATSQDPQLTNADLSTLLAALGALKAALVGADIENARVLAARVGELENGVLGNGGRLAVEPTRRLLAQVRFAGREDERIGAALTSASQFVRRRSHPTDVFVSYKREDRERVQPIVEGLRKLGVDVWIDDELTPGSSFTDEICEEIDFCRAQIVCWSAAGAASDWVRGEAEIGRRRGVLICVAIERCDVRPPFNMLHAEDFSGWRGDVAHPGWRKVLNTLAVRLDRPGLAELAAALESSDERALASWRRSYPADPFNGARHG